MNKINCFNETNEKIEHFNEIKRVIKYTLKKENVKNGIINVIIVNNEEIRKINKDYRNSDRSTDVISFALEDTPNIIKEKYRLLGDIYISIDKVKEQSVLYNHSFKRELLFLTVHGVLHLLKYDHMTKEEERIMFDRQEMILDGYGSPR